MAESAELLSLYAALEESPGDPVTLAALADWFEEHDETRKAECLRWLVATNRQPFRYSQQSEGLIHHFEGWSEGWYWWATARERRGWGYPRSCRLPHQLWARLAHTFDYDPSVFKEYPTVRAALEAVMAVWTRRWRTRRKGGPKAE